MKCLGSLTKGKRITVLVYQPLAFTTNRQALVIRLRINKGV